MSHWSESYIGQEYTVGKADCASLLGKVRREIFSKPVPEDVELNRKASRLGRLAQLADLVDEYGLKTDTPSEGDAVLMICNGRPSHIGVYCLINNEPCVLHAMENAGQVVLHKIRDLSKVLLKVEGYYTWK